MVAMKEGGNFDLAIWISDVVRAQPGYNPIRRVLLQDGLGMRGPATNNLCVAFRRTIVYHLALRLHFLWLGDD